MAVTFTSHGYDTTEANPYTEIPWADAHPYIGSSQYGVRSAGDWKVTKVAGADRTISIAPGFGWGSGVTDLTVANETIQLDVIASGTRWDLIAVRRDWTPTAGESKFVKVNGGSTPTVPGGRLVTPGQIDDQPIALVQVTAGQTQPTTIIDLRCWATNGGMVARDSLALSYLNRLGTCVYIDGTTWRYVPGLNDVPQWVTGDITVLSPLQVTGYAISGTITRKPYDVAGDPKLEITVDINVTRTGAAGAIPSNDWANFGPVLPVSARGDSVTAKYVPVSLVGGSNNGHATVFLNTDTGVMQIRGTTAFTWTTNALFSFNYTYSI